MKKFFTIFAASALAAGAFAQCNPSQLFTALGIPGVYPLPTEALPSGSVSLPYNNTGLTLTFVTSNQAIDPGTLPLPLPFPIPPGIATITVTGITVSNISGLPPGMTSACNNANCSWTFPQQGCILLSGTPTAAGDYTVSFDMALSGTIDTPLGGSPIPNTPLPIQYNLRVNDDASIAEFSLAGLNIYPNPAQDFVMISYPAVEKEMARVELVDLNGRVVMAEERTVNADGGVMQVETSALAQGLYRVVFTCGNVRTAAKLMVTK